MAQKARSNTSVTYNSQELKTYATQADLDRTIDQLETTSLGDTGKTYISGDQSNKLSLQGNWSVALDAILGVDAGSGTKRTAIIVYTEGANTVTYTWTTNAEIENYKIASPANGLRTFSCDLILSGAPSRVAA